MTCGAGVIRTSGMDNPSKEVSPQPASEGAPLAGEKQEPGAGIYAPHINGGGYPRRDGILYYDETRCEQPIEEWQHEGLPFHVRTLASVKKHQEDIHLKMREVIVSGAQIDLVDSQGLAINITSVGTVVTVRAEGDKVFIIVGSTRFPRDDVVQFHFDMAACVDGATVAGLNLNQSG